MYINHGGGWSWRLCPKSASVTEACFQQHILDFADANQTLRFTDGHDVVIPARHTQDGKWARNPIPAAMEEETHQEKEDGQGPGSGESGSSPDASKHAATGTETGLTTAQLEQKKKVQVMVKEFVNIAVGGVRCTYVDFQSGGMAKATYFIDSKIQTFRVTLDGDQGEFSCEFTKILEAQCYGDLGVQLPSIQRIPVEDQKRALLIECQGPQQAAQWLCILEETREKAERFVTCVEILKMYAAVRTSDGPARSTPTA